ncbi:MAG: hypothetical protein BWX80_03471 [Candidatus Hydrogenedentes bacterium ADurb.Bin101]|nr:MAG: hypothetical protein BWX80_03471 [Candidatus Hydrogenedentes bacterium ADurb.Bin101]
MSIARRPARRTETALHPERRTPACSSFWTPAPCNRGTPSGWIPVITPLLPTLRWGLKIRGPQILPCVFWVRRTVPYWTAMRRTRKPAVSLPSREIMCSWEMHPIPCRQRTPTMASAWKEREMRQTDVSSGDAVNGAFPLLEKTSQSPTAWQRTTRELGLSAVPIPPPRLL